MGWTTEICMEGELEEDNSLVIPKSFKDEIGFGHLWHHRDPFLNSADEQLLMPDYWEDDAYNSLTSYSPKLLISIFKKVKAYLKQHQNELPLVHVLSEDKNEVNDPMCYKYGSFGNLNIEGSKCWVEGDTYIYDESNQNGLRNKFNIKSYPSESVAIDFWLVAEKEIEIGDKKYYVNTVSKYEQHTYVLDQIISYCQKAKELDKRIYWFYY